jgi:hypothetical protein
MKIKGRIIFYNPQTGKGTIILHTKEKLHFSVEEWDEFELAPEVNLLVDCDVYKSSLKSITASASQDIAQNDIVGEDEKKDDADEEYTATYSVDEALKVYFDPIEDVIGEPPSVINTKEQLDYFLSRRFLFTAYNNLRGLDSNIYDQSEVKDKINTIEELHKAYNSLSEQIDIPQYAFEMIFLRIQPEYVKNQELREKYKSSIPSLTNLIESLEADLKSGYDNLKKITNKKIHENIKTKLKKMRGIYMDAIHERACIKEELHELANIKQIYTKKYFQEFDKKLSIMQIKYKDMIAKILNYKAYDFDAYLWKCAVKSKPISDYFKSSRIKGTYSTETFLRYYLKTLDTDKVRSEQEGLFKLLEYFEKRNSKS